VGRQARRRRSLACDGRREGGGGRSVVGGWEQRAVGRSVGGRQEGRPDRPLAAAHCCCCSARARRGDAARVGCWAGVSLLAGQLRPPWRPGLPSARAAAAEFFSASSFASRGMKGAAPARHSLEPLACPQSSSTDTATDVSRHRDSDDVIPLSREGAQGRQAGELNWGRLLHSRALTNRDCCVRSASVGSTARPTTGQPDSRPITAAGPPLPPTVDEVGRADEGNERECATPMPITRSTQSSGLRGEHGEFGQPRVVNLRDAAGVRVGRVDLKIK
jgi:hypothetical protein